MITSRLVLALAAVALVPVALAGCSAPGSVLDGGSTDDPAVSGPAGEDAGEAVSEIPATFPPEIPLVDGQVLEASDLGTGWVVLFGVDDAIASFNSGADALAAAGFEEVQRSANDTEGFANYAGDLYTVQLSANVDYPGYGPAVSYTVVKRG